MAKTTFFPVVGQTPEGALVVSGVFSFYETHGMPYDATFMALRDRNRVPSWLHLYRDARKAGIAHDRLIGQLEPPIADAYGPKVSEAVVAVLKTLADLTVRQLDSILEKSAS